MPVYINGEQLNGCTNYASAVSCVGKDGKESTVQAELDAVNDAIDAFNEKALKNDFGEQVLITNKSMDDPFVAPCDGYLKLSRGYSDPGRSQAKVCGATNNDIQLFVTIISTSTDSDTANLFIKKGMRITDNSTDNSQCVYFLPLQ